MVRHGHGTGKRRNACLRSGVQIRIAILKREINSGSGHAKVVVRPVDHVPTEIGYPADMRSDANFQASAELPHAPAFVLIGDATNMSSQREMDNIRLVIAATEDSSAACPDI